MVQEAFLEFRGRDGRLQERISRLDFRGGLCARTRGWN